MHQWRAAGYLSGKTCKRELSQYRVQLARQQLGRLLHRTLAACVMAWFTFTLKRSASRLTYSRAVLRVRSLRLTRSVSAWKHWQQNSRLEKQIKQNEITSLEQTQQLKLELRRAQKMTESHAADQVSAQQRAQELADSLAKSRRELDLREAALHQTQIALAREKQNCEKLQRAELLNAKIISEAQERITREQSIRETVEQEAKMAQARSVALAKEAQTEAATLATEKQTLEVQLARLDGLEGKISHLSEELGTVSAVLSTSPPRAQPRAYSMMATPEELAHQLSQTIVRWDQSNGNILHLAAMEPIFVEGRVLTFVRNHWHVFTSRELLIDVVFEGRNDNQVTSSAPLIVIGRALLLSAGMPVAVAHDLRLSSLYHEMKQGLRDSIAMPGMSPLFSSPASVAGNTSAIPPATPPKRDELPTDHRPVPGPETSLARTSSFGGRLTASGKRVKGRRPRSVIERAMDRIFDMLEDKKLRLIDLFYSIDMDKSGYVDVAELHKAFSKHGIETSLEEVGELLDTLDENGDNRVEASEFLAQVRRVQNQRRARKRHLRAKQSSDKAEPDVGLGHGLGIGRLVRTRESRAERSRQAQQAHVDRVRAGSESIDVEVSFEDSLRN